MLLQGGLNTNTNVNQARHKRFSHLELVFANIKQMFIEDSYAVFNGYNHL